MRSCNSDILNFLMNNYVNYYMVKTVKHATRTSPKALSPQVTQRIREGSLLLVYSFAAFMLLSLLSYNDTDPAWSSSNHKTTILNLGGRVGALTADFLLYMFGYLAYLVPLMLVYGAWYLLRDAREHSSIDYYLLGLKAIGFILVIVSGTGLANLYLINFHYHLPFEAGGIIGNLISQMLSQQFNVVGATVFLLLALMAGGTWYSGISWLKVWHLGLVYGGKISWDIAKYCHPKKLWIAVRRLYQRWRACSVTPRPVMVSQSVDRNKKLQKPTISRKLAVVRVNSSTSSESAPKSQSLKKRVFLKGLPSLDLLDFPAKPLGNTINKDGLEYRSRLLEQTLTDFGVHASVVAVHPGPVITRYELELAPGVKASRLSSLTNDIARSLSMVSVRVVEIIPGKSVVGLELPNEIRQVVSLREIFESNAYQDSPSPLTLGLGKDIAGVPVVANLAKMPHLLVAGTTGSGKSVGVNAMLMSILYKSTPTEVRLILVDPKMLELSIYDGIQHLLTPVVTDMKEAANALRWCVGEMERRYRLMATLGVRNLAGFNAKIEKAQQDNEPIMNPLQPGTGQLLETLPYIVVIIDEFADMMMVVGKKVEQLIARIAQKARAAGIHLILATQRPSVDVITGLIKANIPTRIAFQVSSKIDSRTIIDQQGAEQLLGHGDMLYLPPGSGLPMRIHGAFVADHEVHKLVDSLKAMGEPDYLTEILENSTENSETALEFQGEESADHDPLYDEVVAFVTKSRRASISSVQRRFKVGYNRAARILEEMEQAGVVSGLEQGSIREVLAPPPIEN